MSFSSTSYSFPEQSKSYVYAPQEDIRAYEVAQLLSVLIRAWRNESITGYDITNHKTIPESLNVEIEKLPEDVRRHFKLKQ